ncbi:MAG TPA: rhomboid family intramembrane serine protease [Elusimicrobiota bacterium]|nr:rhomboid family intramembrane serine protease [Elusimicrobiota bacterium]
MVINRPLSFRSLPPTIRGLIVLNGVVYLVQLFGGSRLVALLGLSPARVLQDLWLWQLTTYMFLHGGFFHFLLNMYVLWAFGREIERQWGSWSFLWYYLLCGWGAGVFNVLFSPTSPLPSIGSSGAIYGVLVAFAVMFPQSIIYLYFVIPFRAWQMVLMFAAIEFLAGFSSAATGVANLAHLGGMATGYVYLKGSSFRWQVGRFLKNLRQTVTKKRADGPALHDLDSEVDRILDKILKQGVNSLSREEQELMRRYSKMKK